MKTTVNLKENLDEVSMIFLETYFDFQKDEFGLCCFNKHNEVEFFKFFPSGNASYSRTGKVSEIIEFKSYQDAVDFARI